MCTRTPPGSIVEDHRQPCRAGLPSGPTMSRSSIVWSRLPDRVGAIRTTSEQQFVLVPVRGRPLERERHHSGVERVHDRPHDGVRGAGSPRSAQWTLT